MNKQELLVKILSGQITERDFDSLYECLEEQDDETLYWEEGTPLDQFICHCTFYKRAVFLDIETGIFYGVNYKEDENGNKDLGNSVLKIVRPLGNSWEEVEGGKPDES